MNEQYIEHLKYLGPDGRMIQRPPGLTDIPGGAALAGATTASLGLLLTFFPGVGRLQRFFLLSLTPVGLTALFLTLVRSVLLTTLGGWAVMCWLLTRQGRVVQAAGLGLLAGGIVLGSFSLAVAFGGKTIEERFSPLLEEGVGVSYQRNRGHYLSHTFSEMIYDYPLGAGAGRWGMMYTHFATVEANPSEQIWVEIQIQGWVIDGGLPLLFCYVVAIACAMASLYRLAINVANARIALPAAIVFTINLSIIGLAFSGPTFNTAYGSEFWLLTAATFAATRQPALKPVTRPIERTPATEVAAIHVR
jgi:hypothetical protein